MKPYEGNQPYLFISYAHVDSDRVLPVLEFLSQKGFRIWYDAGIEAGSEWPANIQDHLARCQAMLVFVSVSANESPNCRNEVNYALAVGKRILAAYLEDLNPAKLNYGWGLQLSSLQSLFGTRFADEDAFAEALAAAELLQAAKTKPHQRASKPRLPTEWKEIPFLDPLTGKALDEETLPAGEDGMLTAVDTDWSALDVFLPTVDAPVSRELYDPPVLPESSKSSGPPAEPCLHPRPLLAEDDPKLREALILAVTEGQLSGSMLQRRLLIGYGRALRLLDEMTDRGYLTWTHGASPLRSCRITVEQCEELLRNVVTEDDRLPPALVEALQAEPLLRRVLEAIDGLESISVSFLQRRFSIGYPRAARLMERLEALGFVGAPQKNGLRRVLPAVATFVNHPPS